MKNELTSLDELLSVIIKNSIRDELRRIKRGRHTAALAYHQMHRNE